jgi:hypothetical protein
MTSRVLKYRVAWHPQQHQGVVVVQLTGDGAPLEWRGGDAAEFSAIVHLLQSGDMMYVTPRGWLAGKVCHPAACAILPYVLPFSGLDRLYKGYRP